jgi:hypothetical protein
MLNRMALGCYFAFVLQIVPVFGQSVKCVIETTQSGTMIRVRGIVFPGGHDMFILPEQCPDNRVILTYGDDPTLGRDRLQMKRDTTFQEFERYLREQQPSKPNEICQQCSKYQVEAELSGRLDVAVSAGVKRNPKTGKAIGLEGFGHPLPFTRFRLVITNVAIVSVKELPIMRDKASSKKQ